MGLEDKKAADDAVPKVLGRLLAAEVRAPRVPVHALLYRALTGGRPHADPQTMVVRLAFMMSRGAPPRERDEVPGLVPRQPVALGMREGPAAGDERPCNEPTKK